MSKYTPWNPDGSLKEHNRQGKEWPRKIDTDDAAALRRFAKGSEIGELIGFDRRGNHVFNDDYWYDRVGGKKGDKSKKDDRKKKGDGR
eukprot:2913040-Rhodomonas_salina.1